MLKIITLGLSLLFVQIDARRKWGKCPDYELMENFDPSRYTGLWYEIYRDTNTGFENGSRCVTATYQTLSQTQVSVYNRGIEANGDLNTIEGRATCAGASCKVKFEAFYIPPGNYQLLDTDYTNYAVVYSCTNFFFGLFRNELAWVLGRD